MSAAAQPAENGRVMPVYRITVGPEVLFDTIGIKPSRVRADIHDLRRRRLRRDGSEPLRQRGDHGRLHARIARSKS